MRNADRLLLILCCVSWASAGCDSPRAPFGKPAPPDGYEEYTIERTDYRDPPKRMTLQDDVLDPAKVPEFNPALARSEPVDGWEINLSRTMFHLDVPVLEPDNEAQLLKLRPNYKEAIAAVGRYSQVLPSVNLIDGKAKQFDDGLYAALDQAYYAANEQAFAGHVQIVRRLAEAVGPDSPAAPYLSAGLSLAEVDIPANDVARREKWLKEFEADKLKSKPLGFYNWTPQLQQCWRFLKFMQTPFLIRGGAWPVEASAMAAAIEADETLRADYKRAVDFYARLTNPPVALSLLDAKEETNAGVAGDKQLVQQLHPAVAVFPSSTSREQRLFDRLFPLGFPQGANLMEALIMAVQQGEVDLASNENSGWYDYQCYALETFLLPQRGEETSKLLLSSRYKQRMVDAFAALITKRRETHIRSLEEVKAAAEAPAPLKQLSPKLRLEPNATYYLRTARAYSFLQTFLHEALGKEFLAKLKGLREGGEREMDLATELADQENLFYGFYLLSVEDIGLPSALKEGELADLEGARKRALDWLAHFADDPDLAVDTRVVVPVAINQLTRRTQLWGTAGVRLAKLDIAFDRSFLPSVRPAGSSDDWKVFEGEVDQTVYLIPVDEFVSVEIDRLDCPTRQEFRQMCDSVDSVAKLQQLLQRGKP